MTATPRSIQKSDAPRRGWRILAVEGTLEFESLINNFPDRTAGLVQPDAPIEALGLATQSGPEPKPEGKSPMPEHPSGECSRETLKE